MRDTRKRMENPMAVPTAKAKEFLLYSTSIFTTIGKSLVSVLLWLHGDVRVHPPHFQ